MDPNPKSELLPSLYKASLEQSNARAEVTPLPKLQLIADESSPFDAKKFFNSDELSVIAEIKRASPSKGDLATIEDPLELGLQYQQAGASAISVLTEKSGFKGSLEDLKFVSQGVEIPTLRKDFISNEYQIVEAKAFGASMVLLIMMGLSDAEYSALFNFATEQGLQVLVETHSEQEIKRALEQPVAFLGINTRNLNTFETNINLFGELASLLPADVTRVAESAVRNKQDAALYREYGADAVLVGEALVTGNAKTLIEDFRSVGQVT